MIFPTVVAVSARGEYFFTQPLRPSPSRRGELFALRWRDIDQVTYRLTVRESVYDGHFGTPKTEAGVRQIPLSRAAFALMSEWRHRAERTEADALVFGTRTGGPLAPNNVLRRHVFPACKHLGLPRATWLTFRRTYSSWSHQQGVPGKVTAQLMGHANVDTTLNVYTQVLDGWRQAFGTLACQPKLALIDRTGPPSPKATAGNLRVNRERRLVRPARLAHPRAEAKPRCGMKWGAAA